MDTLAGSAFASTADKVWIPTGPGTYDRFWYKTGASAGWRTTTATNTDTGAVSLDVPLPPSIFIQRRSGGKVVTMDVPAAYSSL